MFKIDYKPTKENLLGEAASIEQSASESLDSWILLGQVEKYEQAIAHVRMLRQAAEIPNIRARRDFLGIPNLYRS